MTITCGKYIITLSVVDDEVSKLASLAMQASGKVYYLVAASRAVALLRDRQGPGALG